GLRIAIEAHRMETARLAMTARATGDERNPPRDRPLSGATAVDQDLNPLQHLIHQRLRERGWSYGEVARRGGVPRSPVYTLAPTRNLAPPPHPPPHAGDPARPPPPGPPRGAPQGPRPAGLSRPRRSSRVHRAALLRRGPG